MPRAVPSLWQEKQPVLMPEWLKPAGCHALVLWHCSQSLELVG